jgi:hypothetical protein
VSVVISFNVDSGCLVTSSHRFPKNNLFHRLVNDNCVYKSTCINRCIGAWGGCLLLEKKSALHIQTSA